jgi:phosphoribosylanthranilate isomerase
MSAPVPASEHQRTRIKICGLTREADVHAAVSAGVDAIGFVLYAASPRAVTPARAAELARLLPPFVTPVLLFVNHSAGDAMAALATVPGAWAQFHGDETAAHCLAVARQSGRPFIRAARIDDSPQGAGFNLLEYAQHYSEAQALLLDAHVAGYGGGGKVFNWSLLPPNVDAHLVLSGGLDSANVGNGIALLRPRCRTLAIDVSSGVEADAPGGGTLKGIKDPAKIHQFVAAVRAADHHLAGKH